MTVLGHAPSGSFAPWLTRAAGVPLPPRWPW